MAPQTTQQPELGNAAPSPSSKEWEIRDGQTELFRPQSVAISSLPLPGRPDPHAVGERCKRHEPVESRMRGDMQVRFGGRIGETDRLRSRHRASVRPLQPLHSLQASRVCDRRCRHPLLDRLPAHPRADAHPGAAAVRPSARGPEIAGRRRAAASAGRRLAARGGRPPARDASGTGHGRRPEQHPPTRPTSRLTLGVKKSPALSKAQKHRNRLLRRAVIIAIVATLAVLLLSGTGDTAGHGSHAVRQFQHAARPLEQLLQHTLKKATDRERARPSRRDRGSRAPRRPRLLHQRSRRATTCRPTCPRPRRAHSKRRRNTPHLQRDPIRLAPRPRARRLARTLAPHPAVLRIHRAARTTVRRSAGPLTTGSQSGLGDSSGVQPRVSARLYAALWSAGSSADAATRWSRDCRCRGTAAARSRVPRGRRRRSQRRRRRKGPDRPRTRLRRNSGDSFAPKPVTQARLLLCTNRGRVIETAAGATMQKSA